MGSSSVFLDYALASSGIVSGVLSIIVVTARDLFQTIQTPSLEGDPTTQRPIFQYRNRRADKMRWLLTKVPAALLIIYGSGGILVYLHFSEIIVIKPLEDTTIRNFTNALNCLNFIIFLFGIYLVRLGTLVRAYK